MINQPSSSNDGKQTITGQVVKSTKTGDSTPIITMTTMLLVAGLGIMVLRKRKYNR